MNDEELEKIYLRHPGVHGGRNAGLRLLYGCAGLVLAPIYLALAHGRGTPGLVFRRRCAQIALAQLSRIGRGLPFLEIHRLLVSPMDSVRYFEFQFVWDRAVNAPGTRYLDVSSPRLLPLLLSGERRDLQPVLLNPDESDLAVTRTFATAFGLDSGMGFSSDLIEGLSIPEGSLDLITCISVLEHIPDDRAAIKKMWSLLKPGGRLLLTVPCASKAVVEVTDHDLYGLLKADEQGFVFWQRYYDESLLRVRLFAEVGDPVDVQIYGERAPGLYARNVQQKMAKAWRYAGWREPHLMSREFAFYPSIAELPGMGVAGLEFRKF